jgi:hypothetical protein
MIYVQVKIKFKDGTRGMTLYQFFGKYAPDSDQGPGLAKSKQYAEFVADRIGVSPNTQLRSLV